MKRMSIIGLSLLALVAFSAVMASSASAGEIVTCVKKAGGKYSDKACSKLAGTTKEEKYEVGSAVGTKITSKGKEAKLETVEGKVICKKNTDAGEITGPKTDIETVTFEECTNSVFGTPCLNTGKGEKKGGVIVVKNNTKLLESPEKGAGGKTGPTGTEAWNQFEANGELGPYIAVFHCETPLGEDPFAVTGTVAGPLTPTNAATKKATFSSGASEGEQNLTTHTASSKPPYEEVELASTQVGTDSLKFSQSVIIKIP